MDRYSNKAYENRLEQSNKVPGIRLNPDHFQSGTRKLYQYSGNLDDSRCILPPVLVDEGPRRGVVNKYQEDGHMTDVSDCQRQRYDTWDQVPTITLENATKAAPRGDWKEERRLRVENAMKRVEQSYVGELRHDMDETTYVRHDRTNHQDSRKPHALVPLQYTNLTQEFGDTRGFAEDQRLEQYDRSLLIPSSKDKSVDRSLEEEMELDMKRQILLERKIREANEFQRKIRASHEFQKNQKLNAFKPIKEDQKEKAKGNKHASHSVASSSQPNIPAPPPREDRNAAPYPMPPSILKQDESYSKRKRKLKPCAAVTTDQNVRVECLPERGRCAEVPRKDTVKYKDASTGFTNEIPDTREGRYGVSFDVDTTGFEKAHYGVNAAQNVHVGNRGNTAYRVNEAREVNEEYEGNTFHKINAVHGSQAVLGTSALQRVNADHGADAGHRDVKAIHGNGTLQGAYVPHRPKVINDEEALHKVNTMLESCAMKRLGAINGADTVNAENRFHQVNAVQRNDAAHGRNVGHVNLRHMEEPLRDINASGASKNIPTRPTGPKPPLIPRQASFNIWNGDTAKRGLGFKSKLRKEMEEASLRSLEPKEDADAHGNTQRPYVSSEVAAKWKRKMFYGN